MDYLPVIFMFDDEKLRDMRGCMHMRAIGSYNKEYAICRSWVASLYYDLR